MAFYRLSVVVITLLIAMNGIGTLAILEANPENLEAKSSSADDNIQNAPERPEQEEPEDGGAYYDNPIPPYDASVVPIEKFDLESALKVETILEKYIPRENERIPISIQIRDTIGKGLQIREQTHALKELLKNGLPKKLGPQKTEEFIKEFDLAFPSNNN